MPSLRKLLRRMRQNDRTVRFPEAQRVMRAAGFDEKKGRGSHVKFVRDDAPPVVIAKPHGGAEAYIDPKAVAEVLQVWDDYGDE